MKRLSILAVLTILVCAHSMTLAQPAAADEHPASVEAKNAESLVESVLIKPLAARERNRGRFTRASLPPQARRVRLLDEKPHTDANGDRFFAFAIDARQSDFLGEDEDKVPWRLAAVTGCIYVERGDIFVKSGDAYRPAAYLLGKNLKPAAQPTCQQG